MKSFQIGSPPVLTLWQRHKRYHTINASWKTRVGRAFVFRGQCAYLINSILYTDSPFDADGVVRKDQIKYMVGFDSSNPLSRFTTFAGLNRWDFNFQFIQFIVVNHNDYMINQPWKTSKEEVETYFTLQITSDYRPDKTVLPRVLIAYTNDGDWWVKPEIRWEPGNHWRIKLYGGLFWGDGNELFGQFHKQDVLGWDIAYHF